jgi:hypothetical protein
MTEFSTEAVFEATIDPASLRDARRTIENELGDPKLPIDVRIDAQTKNGATGAPGPMDDRTTRLLERELEVEHGLSRERNELLRSIAGETEQQTFDRALSGGGGMGGMGAGLLGAGLGALAGSGLASALANFDPKLKPPKIDIPEIPDVDVPVPPALDPVDVDAPKDIPLDHPDSIPLDYPDGIPLEKPDWVPLPVANPDSSPEDSPTDDSPSSDPTSDPNRTPSGYRKIRDRLPDDSPSSPPAPVPFPDVTPTPQPGDGSPATGPTLPEFLLGGAGAGYGALGLSRLTDALTKSGSAASLPFMIPSLVASSTSRQAERKSPEQRNPIERLFADLTPDVKHDPRMAMQYRTRTATESASMSVAKAKSQKPAEVTVETTVNVDGVTERDLDRAMEEAKRDVENKLKRAAERGSL